MLAAGILRLKQLAREFRTAILCLEPGTPELAINDFLFGVPSDANLLLSKYLQVNGFDGIEYVVGQRGDGQQHAWLEIKDVVIDISADQFIDGPQFRPVPSLLDDAPIGVTVELGSKWHAQLKEERRRPGGIDAFDDAAKHRFREAYEQVISKIKLNP
jgi:hypothetical protein